MTSLDSILADRHQTHGDYSEHALITQELKRVMQGSEGYWHKLSDSQREALDMIAHKIGRVLAGNPHFKDHWDDIAGYARLVSERITP